LEVHRGGLSVQLRFLNAERAQRLFFENPQFAYHVMQLIAGRLRELVVAG
jgi:hypothetical protein